MLARITETLRGMHFVNQQSLFVVRFQENDFKAYVFLRMTRNEG
jgi:hypothetical protein